jgi:hypothetical protein
MPQDEDQQLRALQKQGEATDAQMAEATRIVMTSTSGPSQQLQQYFQSQGLARNHGEAWCAETAAAIQKSLGRQIPGPDKEGSSYPLARRWVESWGKDTPVPHVGDVIATGGKDGYLGHSGHARTVTGVDEHGGIDTVGGNEGSAKHGSGKITHYDSMDAALHPRNERTGAVDPRQYHMKTPTAKELPPGTLGEPTFSRRATPVQQSSPEPTFARNETPQRVTQVSDTSRLQRRGVTPNASNPANPYFNTSEHEYAVVSDSGAGDPTKQGRLQISPQSLAGVDSSSLPYAKVHNHHSQESPTWNSQHSYKNGNMVKVRKVGDEWEVVGNPGTINT